MNDLAASSFYAGGITEQAVGRAAPWFVIAVMLFGFAIKSVYLESCSMFVRGGVYVVVRNSMGRFAARLSVSALVFDFILTGPISGVSAGHYLAGLINQTLHFIGLQHQIRPNVFALAFALSVTSYFWWANIRGIRESSKNALRIMQVMTVMVAILLIWCPITLLLNRELEVPPAPTAANLTFSPEAEGWLRGTILPSIPAIGILIAFSHAFLSMSGFETLAQVYREINHPKLPNLKKAANIVVIYALISTGLVTLFAGMIIPEGQRGQYVDNLIAGLAMNLAGPEYLRYIFQIVVVIAGTLILSGAINTSIIGANGILNRVAEDGVLTDWFRQPHRRFGTTHHIINTVIVLQALTIIFSFGDVYILGEAYAFGVVWSFFFKSLGVLALRFQRTDQDYKTPVNIVIRGREWPIGLAAVTGMLLLVALSNLFTKQIATVYGLCFTLLVFVVFTVSERINARRRDISKKALEEFNLIQAPQVGSQLPEARPGCVLVSLRDYWRLQPLAETLKRSNLTDRGVVVMTVRPLRGEFEYELSHEQIFTDYEKKLFTGVVEMAERYGQTVGLLVIPSNDPYFAMVQAATTLRASRLVIGMSRRISVDELARRIGLSWEQLPEPHHIFTLEIIIPRRSPFHVSIGPHRPRLWPVDLELIHQIWLELSESDKSGLEIHHRDIVALAVQRLDKELRTGRRKEIIDALHSMIEEETRQGARGKLKA